MLYRDPRHKRAKSQRNRIYINVHKYANTSAAALAIALDEAVRDGTIKRGNLVALTVFGEGFTWGATVLEWEKDTTKPK